LRELVRRVSDELEQSHPGVRFTVAVTGDTTGSWDEDLLCQVLSNLVGNAVQHGAREHGVRIALDGSAANSIVLTVHNVGSIPSERLRHLFAPFEANASRKHGSSGLGLGLFIAHELARAHGGSLDAQSSSDAGTTFTLTLPRTAAPDTPRKRPDTSPAAAEDDEEIDGWQRSIALGETGEKFRLLVESVKDYAIFMLDTRGRVATWNAGAERIKGYQAREIIGQHFSVFYAPDDVASGLCERELALAASEGRLETEGLRVRKDGTAFWANVVITALYDQRGTLTGFAKVTRDLTDRRRLEEERIRRAQAEEAVRVRDEFLSVASHELRTPLAIVELQLDALETHLPGLDPSLARTLSRARRGTSQLTRLVNSLLAATRIAIDGFTLFRETFDLAQVLAACIDGLRKPAELAGCELTTAFEAPLVGTWDRRRLEQLVTNLVWNALTYAPGAPVRVGATRDGGAVLIEVSDHGPGVDPADAERVFERFERACVASEYSGLGLGLYVVREIARAHGGSASVDTSPGGGARFLVRIPAGTPAP
jgi:PAS domain S-box-containing protein